MDMCTRLPSNGGPRELGGYPTIPSTQQVMLHDVTQKWRSVGRVDRTGKRSVAVMTRPSLSIEIAGDRNDRTRLWKTFGHKHRKGSAPAIANENQPCCPMCRLRDTDSAHHACHHIVYKSAQRPVPWVTPWHAVVTRPTEVYAG